MGIRGEHAERIDEILADLSLREKASLCSGKDYWHTKPIKRLKVPSVSMSDGPHGLRRQEGNIDIIGEEFSRPATCFPTSATTACSWDKELLREIGAALGEEALAEGVSVVLGPGANIKRSPLCGRNFEYFSEDPFLGGELAAAWIEGLQAKGVGASLKHFAANNQEGYRMTVDAIVDERALREIYLSGFERAVRKAKPLTVMAAYNKVNGSYCCESRRLLEDILRKEWLFEGIVISDWGACNDRVEGVKAGLDLEMPSSGGVNDRAIVKAVKKGRLDAAELEVSVQRLVGFALEAGSRLVPGFEFDREAHHTLGRRAARESAVLLKNEGSILPLSIKARIAVLGAFAETPRYQGSGSSLINPVKLESVLDGMREAGVDFVYAPGYRIEEDLPDEALISSACALAASCDAVVVFAGLPPAYESEGFDRESLGMPESHTRLIERAAEAAKGPLAVVLANGSPVEMPWIDSVPSVLECYLGGEAGGPAAVDLLLGKLSPSGKLAETFPLRIEDTPCHGYFPSGPRRTEYRETLYVGYRYYDTAKRAVLFPFGHGLSFTEFVYSGLEIHRGGLYPREGVSVSFCIKNSGSRPGAEIAQVYVRDIESSLFRPEKELKGFEKVFLEPGETKRASINLDERAFAFFDPRISAWRTESGEFEILVGSSSRDVRLKATLVIESEDPPPPPEGESDAVAAAYRNLSSKIFEAGEEAFSALCGNAVSRGNAEEPVHQNTPLSEIRRGLLGKGLYSVVVFLATLMYRGEGKDLRRKMVVRAVDELPLRNIVTMSGGIFPKFLLRFLIWAMNR